MDRELNPGIGTNSRHQHWYIRIPSTKYLGEPDAIQLKRSGEDFQQLTQMWVGYRWDASGMVWAVPLAERLMNEAGGSLPSSSCVYRHLASLPHLLRCQAALTSDPLHEGTYLSGEISLSVPPAKPKLGPTVNFNLRLTATHC